MTEIDGRSVDDFSAMDIRRMLAILWRSELPIAVVMEMSRKLGDDLTVRDVFIRASETGDPLADWIETLTEGIE